MIRSLGSKRNSGIPILAFCVLFLILAMLFAAVNAEGQEREVKIIPLPDPFKLPPDRFEVRVKTDPNASEVEVRIGMGDWFLCSEGGQPDLWIGILDAEDIAPYRNAPSITVFAKAMWGNNDTGFDELTVQISRQPGDGGKEDESGIFDPDELEPVKALNLIAIGIVLIIVIRSRWKQKVRLIQ